MGGGGMLRAASRAVARTGVANGTLQDSLSASSSRGSNAATSRHTRNRNSSSGSGSVAISSAGSPSNLPISANSGLPSWGLSPTSSVGGHDDFDWVSVEGSEDEDFGVGPVPSVDEVHEAVSALKQVFDAPPYRSELVKDRFGCYSSKDDRISSSTGLVRVQPDGSELDWVEPAVQPCGPKNLKSQASDQVYEAFHLLRTEPLVQRMVLSLSSDKAMWDAVMNNEVVREIRESYNAGLTEANENPEEVSDQSGEDSNPAKDFVKWVFENTKAKVIEALENITKLVAVLFKPQEDEKTKVGSADPFQEKLRTSVMLSVVVLLVVVVARAARA